MQDDDGYFGEPVAATYDEDANEMFAAEVVNPTVDSSGPFRYVWPAELDLMAQMAGLELRERWAGWGREPFTSDSTKHVSVWRKDVG